MIQFNWPCLHVLRTFGCFEEFTFYNNIITVQLEKFGKEIKYVVWQSAYTTAKLKFSKPQHNYLRLRDSVPPTHGQSSHE